MYYYLTSVEGVAPGLLHRQLTCLKNVDHWEHIVHAKPIQSCLTLHDPMDHSPSGSSVHGILQARILEWVAMPFSRGSSRPRGWTCISYVSCIGRWVLYQYHHLPLPIWRWYFFSWMRYDCFSSISCSHVSREVRMEELSSAVTLFFSGMKNFLVSPSKCIFLLCMSPFCWWWFTWEARCGPCYSILLFWIQSFPQGSALFKKLFIYLLCYSFLAALGLCCFAWACSSRGERGLFVVVGQLLIIAASLVAEHGF